MTGTPVYFREKMFESFGTPVKTCLKVTGTPVKACRKFGSGYYFESDLLRLWYVMNRMRHSSHSRNSDSNGARLLDTQMT